MGPGLRRTATVTALALLGVCALSAVREVALRARAARDRRLEAEMVLARLAQGALAGGSRVGERRLAERVRSAEEDRVPARDGENASHPFPKTGTEPFDPEGPLEVDPAERPLEPFQAQVKVSDFALPAKPDSDPSTGAEAAAVEPGAAPELAFRTFADHGADSVERVAELVGERKPEVEDGVPVSLTGRVLDAERGTPLPRARVVVTSTFYVRRYMYDHHLREVAHVETDEEGAFTVERLNVDPAHFGDGGRLYLTVTAEGHAPSLAVPLAKVSPGIANRLPDVSLAVATESLTGRVLDMWEKKPVVGARIYATGAIDPITYPKDERPALFVGAPSAVTDDDGRFVLTGLAKGVEVVSAHGGDDCIGREIAQLPRADELVVLGRQIRGHIEGTTLDERGNPVALVTVEGGENSTHSFADGKFVLENFRGDTVTIRFTHPDYPPVVLADVPNGAAGLVVRLERPRPSVVLAVEDADTSAPMAKVDIEFAFADEKSQPAPTSKHRLASDGRYTVRIPEGGTSVTVSAAGRRAEVVPLAGRTDGEIVRVMLASAQ